MFVYVIVNSENLKIYVGQHKGENLRKYLQDKFSHAKREQTSHSHLYAAMRKHPREAWSIHPLISGIEEKKELDECERLLIYALKSQHPDVGYNICDGGEGGHGVEMTPEVRAKIGAANALSQLGLKQSPETVAKRLEKTRGQKRTPEQAARISLARSGKGLGNRNAAGIRPEMVVQNIRLSWTPERRAAWSEYKKKHPTGIARKSFE